MDVGVEVGVVVWDVVSEVVCDDDAVVVCEVVGVVIWHPTKSPYK